MNEKIRNDHLERAARYEVRRAQRQFDAVDPENGLVASELEQRWNHALAQVAELEAHAQRPRETPEPLSDGQKETVARARVRSARAMASRGGLRGTEEMHPSNRAPRYCREHQ
jgi:hypothetical protein